MTQTADMDYILSLPERSLRSMASLIGGGTLLLTNTFFPDVLRKSTTYQSVIGDFQRILITKIGQVDHNDPLWREGLGDDFVRQKMVGGVLESIGLLTVRFSPLWVFAIAGDAAAGSKAFLYRLVEHLKRNDVIAPKANPESLAELLDTIQTASHTSAKAIDTPPLSRRELSDVADDLTASYGNMFSTGHALLPRFDSLQARMEQLATREDVSVEALSGMMAVEATSLGKTSISTSLALGKTSSELFGEQILDSYARTLDEISQKGAGNYLRQSMMPFLKAAAGHFAPDKPTWTESWLNKDRKREP